MIHHQHHSTLWDLNKAAVFVDAMDVAARSDQSHGSANNDRTRSWVRAPRRAPVWSQWSVAGLTPRMATVVIGLTAVLGLAVASWAV